jgi:hypothetical protein
MSPVGGWGEKRCLSSQAHQGLALQLLQPAEVSAAVKRFKFGT